MGVLRKVVIGLAALSALVGCSGTPFQRVPPPDSDYVATYKAGFALQRVNLDRAISDLLACRTVDACNDAANRIDIWTTGLGDYPERPSGVTPPAIPTCLADAHRHVMAAYIPLRRGSHDTFGHAPAPPSAQSDLRTALEDLDQAEALLAHVHC